MTVFDAMDFFEMVVFVLRQMDISVCALHATPKGCRARENGYWVLSLDFSMT